MSTRDKDMLGLEASLDEPRYANAASTRFGATERLSRTSNWVESYLQQVTEKTDVSDIHLGLSVDGERTFFRRGKRCPGAESAALSESSFGISCLSKPLVAATVIESCIRGELDIDAPIARYLPELSGTSRGDLTTLRHLISNTAGYRGYLYFPILSASKDRDRLLRRIRNAESLFWPGHVFSYENSVAALIVEIMDRVSMEGAGPLVNRTIFQPLGITVGPQVAHSAHAHDVSADRAGLPSRVGYVDIRLTMPQLLSVVEVFVNGQSPSGSQSILSHATVETLRKRIVDIPRRFGSISAALLPVASGTGIQLYRGGYYGYEGSTSEQTVGFRICPRRQIAIVLGIGQPARNLRRAILRDVLDFLDASEEVSSNVHEHVPSGERHAVVTSTELTGFYAGSHGVDVKVEASQRNQSIVVTGFVRGMKPVFQVKGRLGSDGDARFQSRDPGSEPELFRYPRTGELCLMIGMSAFKKMPYVYV